MIVLGEWRLVGDAFTFQARCSLCGKSIGDLGADEVNALISARYYPIECFECEQWAMTLIEPKRPELWPMNERIVSRETN